MPLELRPTFLVVDDERAIRKLVQVVLEGENCRVFEAGDGGQALRVIEREPAIELLITDLRMPVMSGKRLGIAARQLRPSLKILYLTGHADLLFQDRVVLGDEEAFLEKPFTRRGLLEAVALLTDPQPMPAVDVRGERRRRHTPPGFKWLRRLLPVPPASVPGL